MNTFINNNKFNKKKVVLIMGETGMGKSHLSGLEIFTNKITHTEKQGVQHYLLGENKPDSDFTAKIFNLQSIVYINFIFLKT
ncbi:hypothetical protein H5410_020894 [Solanum commersonii]|uniref:Isopentenyltransferase n=1 Tax=Solanum commersonii TaxID=4109 RepID=A0A9J5ZB68_SOLCO|nr:hypothetical protein H5410_020894 [Solanum commersonii]